ncbi:hypothetical protein D3C78_1738160 [compost metagenome]
MAVVVGASTYRGAVNHPLTQAANSHCRKQLQVVWQTMQYQDQQQGADGTDDKPMAYQAEATFALEHFQLH